MPYSQAQLLFFAGAAVVAAAFDVGRRKIPNWVTVPIAVTGLMAQGISGGLGAAAGGVIAALIVGTLLVLGWRKHVLGGGDVKLGVSAAVWVGLARVPQYLFASVLIGGLVAIACYMFSSKEAREAIWANVSSMHAPDLVKVAQAPGRTVLVPYGAAFAVGALLTLARGGAAA